MRTLNEYIKFQINRNGSNGHDIPLDLVSCCSPGNSEITLETAAEIYSPYYIE